MNSYCEHTVLSLYKKQHAEKLSQAAIFFIPLKKPSLNEGRFPLSPEAWGTLFESPYRTDFLGA